jgi:hypothetical protein
MNILEYMKQAERIHPAGVLFDMPGLFAASVSKGTFPPSLPLPENLNAVSRSRAGILNGQRLELYALNLGLDRGVWLFASDAAFLGLETKKNLSQPLTLVSKTGYAGSVHAAAETAYLIDQFTPSSLERMYSFANPGINSSENHGLEEPMLSARNRTAVNAVYALSRYDSGLGGKAARKNARKNLRDNSRPGSAGFKSALRTYALYTSSLPEDSKTVFDFLRSYYTQQLSGEPLLDNTRFNKHILIKSMKKLSGDKEAVIKTFFYAKDFSQRLVSPSFSIDYSQSVPAPVVIAAVKHNARAGAFREGS